MQSKGSLLLAVVFVAVLVSCGALEPSDIAGNYQATRFTGSGDIGDVLTQGGNIQINLQADGTTTGVFTIPATLAEGDTLTVLNLNGTFTLTDGIVTFDHASDTFIRDTEWAVDGNTLSTSATFAGTTLDVVLTKQGN